MTGADQIDPDMLANYQTRLARLDFHAVGFVEGLIITPQPDEHRQVSSLRVVPDVGVEGQYPGKQWWRGKRVPGRQISAMNAEVLEALEIEAEVPGDNLIIRGFDLATLEVGDVVRIGEALLTVTPTPHRPCAKFARRTSPTKKAAISEGRWRGRLLDARLPAVITVGDAVERIILG